jgi:hypothetical protein
VSFENHPNATAEIGPYLLVPPSTYGNLVLEISEGQVSLDKSRVPYGVASVTVPQQDEDLVEQVDPYDNQRVVIEASDGTSTRTFDLVMTNRTVNHKSKTVELELATDEALLTGYAPLAADATPRDYESDLRDLVNYVLNEAIPGAALEAGSDTADMTAYWAVTNVVQNALCDTTSGFSAGTNANSLAAESSPATPVLGSAYCYYRSGAAGASYLDVTGAITVKPGDKVVGSAYLQNGAVVMNGYVMVRFYNADGNTVTDALSSPVTLSITDWNRVSVFATAPPNAQKARLFLRADATGASQSIRFDAPMLYEGTELIAPFSGASTTPTTYTYSYAGAAAASASTRTPVLERKPELFTWAAGVSAWDFLEPFTTSSQLWLFCDEQRRFWLVDPVAFSVPGRVTAQVSNTSEGSDTIDSSSGLKADGIIARYTWEDAAGNKITKDDTAGTAGRVLILEFDRPYPGPGTAAMLLAKRNGLGRTQEVTVGSDLTATPGVEVSITLPGTHTQVGTVKGVTWYLKRGLMDLKSVGLREIPPGAIDLLSGTIDSLAGTIDSLS